ncbi:hypothetical protein MH1LPH_03270 [Lactiplantibacillus brownii]
MLVDSQTSQYELLVTPAKTVSPGIFGALPQTDESQWWLLISLLGIICLLLVAIGLAWWRGHQVAKRGQ